MASACATAAATCSPREGSWFSPPGDRGRLCLSRFGARELPREALSHFIVKYDLRASSVPFTQLGLTIDARLFSGVTLKNSQNQYIFMEGLADAG